MFLVLITGKVNAGCAELTTYKDSEIFIVISEFWCDEAEILSAPVVNGEIQAELSSTLRFYEECELDFDKNPVFLKCRVNEKNPLSGATYERIQQGQYTCAGFEDQGPWPTFVYRCVQGCEGVPNELPETWSCH